MKVRIEFAVLTSPDTIHGRSIVHYYAMFTESTNMFTAVDALRRVLPMSEVIMSGAREATAKDKVEFTRTFVPPRQEKFDV